MAVKPEIFTGKVMHKRLFPNVNAFTYGIYYLCLPLEKMAQYGDDWRLGISRPAVVGFHAQDHAGRCSDADLAVWAQQVLQSGGLNIPDAEFSLMAMPRILGYVFNPVSFWFCQDASGALRAVICEVNNTFGETHSYLCAHADGRAINGDEWMSAQKMFHVSPFLQREGRYEFRFDLQADKTGIWIDYYDAAGNKQLLTALTGRRMPLTRQSLRKAFWSYPLVTLRAIFLIHWQALKLVAKKIKYIPKPLQKKEKISSVDNLTKN